MNEGTVGADRKASRREFVIATVALSATVAVPCGNNLFAEEPMLTDLILRSTDPAEFVKPEVRREMIGACEAFIRMYRPHEAREDTVLFPALYEIEPAEQVKELGERRRFNPPPARGPQSSAQNRLTIRSPQGNAPRCLISHTSERLPRHCHHEAVSVKAVATLLNVSPTCAYSLAEQGRLPRLPHRCRPRHLAVRGSGRAQLSPELKAPAIPAAAIEPPRGFAALPAPRW
jgi:hypothetical protein